MESLSSSSSAVIVTSRSRGRGVGSCPTHSLTACHPLEPAAINQRRTSSCSDCNINLVRLSGRNLFGFFKIFCCRLCDPNTSRRIRASPALGDERRVASEFQQETGQSAAAHIATTTGRIFAGGWNSHFLSPTSHRSLQRSPYHRTPPPPSSFDGRRGRRRRRGEFSSRPVMSHIGLEWRRDLSSAVAAAATSCLCQQTISNC